MTNSIGLYDGGPIKTKERRVKVLQLLCMKCTVPMFLTSHKLQLLCQSMIIKMPPGSCTGILAHLVVKKK